MHRRFGFLVAFWIVASALGGFLVLSAPAARGGLSVSGPLLANTTWTLADSPIWVEGNVTVPAGVMLTVEAGVEVRFNGPYDLVVDGVLEVQGLAGAPAVFTSNQTSPAPGDWGYVLLQGTGSGVAYANVTYGSGCLSVLGTTNDVLGSGVSRCSTGPVLAGSGNLFRDGFVGSSASWGIQVAGQDNELSNTTVAADLSAGIFVTGVRALVQNNTVRSYPTNPSYGINVASATEAVVRGNTVLGPGGGGDTGVSVQQSTGVALERNRIEGFTVGLVTTDASFPTTNDTFAGNTIDVYFPGPGNAHVTALNDSFDPAKVAFNPGAVGSDLTTMWFLDANVTDVLGDPVAGATVRVWDVSGAPVFVGTTGAGGHAPWIALEENVRSRTFWLNATPDAVRASLYGPDAVNVSVFMDRSKELRLVLNNDLLPPRITNVTAAPDPQEQFLAVNVTADVVDQNLVSVSLDVTYPDATSLNVTMQHGAGDAYYVARAYDQVGVHAFRITAIDAFGNTSTADGTFRIIPPLPPAITNVTAAPDPQGYGGTVSITATVRDQHALSAVTVRITYPDATTATFPMLLVGGDRFAFSQAYDQVGLHAFTIRALCAAGASAEWNGTFRIVDTVPPNISSVAASPDPQIQGLAVNVSATITDKSSVTASLNVTYPDGSSSNATMSSAGTTFFLGRTYAQLGLHRFRITAVDAYGNAAYADGTFVVWPPNLGPSITNVAATPDPQEYGGRVNVTATVVDPDGIASVSLEVRFPDSSTVTYAMANAGTTWFLERAYAQLGTYLFTITATDGNVSYTRTSTSNGTFVIVDTTPPVANAGPDQVVPQFTTVTFDGSASTDNVGIANYTWTFADGGPVLLYGVAPTYKFNRLGTFVVTLTVKDGSGNSASDLMTVTVRDTTPPRITGASATPSPVEAPGATNVSFGVVEANTVVGAWVLVFNTTGIFLTNLTAAYDAGSGRYFASWTLTDLGTYRFNASAVDQAGNVGSADVFVLARDTTPPVVSATGAAPDPQEVLRPVLLWAQASDAYLAGVSVAVRNPFGAPAGNVTLVYNGTTLRYEGLFLPTFLGTYALTAWAVDTSGNAGSLGATFVSQDTQPPVLSGVAVSPYPQDLAGLVDVSVVATDNYVVVAVVIQVTTPLGLPYGSPANMTFRAADGRYHDVRPYPDLGNYTFTVSAADPAGHVTTSPPGRVWIVDRVPPVVANVRHTPFAWEVGGAITVTATVSDNVAVARVSLQVLDPQGREAGNHTMACDPAGRCSFTRTYGLAGNYTLRVWAADTSGNLAYGDTDVVMVAGEGPTANAGPDQTVDPGTKVALNGSSSFDDWGIVSYEWTFSYRNAGITLEGALANFTFDDPGTYTVTLTVADSAGRTSTDTMVVTVRGGGGGAPGVDLWLAVLAVALLVVLGAVLAWRSVRRRRRENEELDNAAKEPEEGEELPPELKEAEAPAEGGGADSEDELEL